MAGFHLGTKRSFENTLQLEDDIKKAKVEEKTNMNDMSRFKLVKVLSEDSNSKTIILHLQDQPGSDDNTCAKDAVSILERTPLSEVLIDQILSNNVDMNLQFNNDIYFQYLCSFPPQMNIVKNTLIYPANEKHLKKYSAQQVFMVAETPEAYKKITVPYLEEQQVHLQWVYNILEKQAEADRILFEDANPENGFILLPDLKWDQKQKRNLYVVAISHKHGIRTLRDLNEKHLPMLKNILEKGTATIKNTYGIHPSQLRVYVHYQASYFHFHVHFTHMAYHAPGSLVGKAHLLQDIIDNIENIDNNYYKKKTLFSVLKEQSKLFLLFKAAGLVETDIEDNDTAQVISKKIEN